MALNIVLGKPKTGKSTYIYENIEKDIKNNKDVILFVPSQRRQETENNYIKYLKNLVQNLLISNQKKNLKPLLIL